MLYNLIPKYFRIFITLYYIIFLFHEKRKIFPTNFLCDQNFYEDWKSIILLNITIPLEKIFTGSKVSHELNEEP